MIPAVRWLLTAAVIAAFVVGWLTVAAALTH